ncbi:MAG: response regulator [Betaproteobacteria bacterium HGW-Betaproteobacteria-15]|nr:MAG: response regulator [Betaproteobacteria bacterium HGW-Betaproteobacteria-15]
MKAFERFVLIDDNEADNVFHEIMIRRTGFTGDILIFMSGPEALEFFRTDELSLTTCIFLDINMPLMSGFEVAEEAAPLIAGKSSIVLVMLTSSGSPDDMERARSMKIIKGYVTKPLGTAAVSALLEGEVPTFDGKS